MLAERRHGARSSGGLCLSSQSLPLLRLTNPALKIGVKGRFTTLYLPSFPPPTSSPPSSPSYPSHVIRLHRRQYGIPRVFSSEVSLTAAIQLLRRHRALAQGTTGRGLCCRLQDMSEELCQRVEKRQCSGRDSYQAGQEGLCQYPPAVDGCSGQRQSQPHGR